MDKLLEIFVFSLVTILAIITLGTFFVEPMEGESKFTDKLLNTVMFALLTLFILFIIMIAIVRVGQWTNY